MDCYVFDLDGTLADCGHRLHHIKEAPKDWRAFFAACINDAPIPHMIGLARDLHNAGAVLVYISGRSDECEGATVEWMYAHELPPGKLYMRKAGDLRADNVIKAELLARVRADGFVPIMAFEDRDRVVKMYRELGIPCAQVAEGAF